MNGEEGSGRSSVQIRQNSKGPVEVTVKAYDLQGRPTTIVEAPQDPAEPKIVLADVLGGVTETEGPQMVTVPPSLVTETVREAVSAWRSTVALLQSNGVEVAGDPDRKLLKRWTQEAEVEMAGQVANEKEPQADAGADALPDGEQESGKEPGASTTPRA